MIIRQTLQSCVKREQIRVSMRSSNLQGIAQYSLSIASTFERLFSATTLDQNPPHRLRRGCVEMSSVILLRCVALIHQPYVSFMHQGGWLERVS